MNGFHMFCKRLLVESIVNYQWVDLLIEGSLCCLARANYLSVVSNKK